MDVIHCNPMLRHRDISAVSRLGSPEIIEDPVEWDGPSPGVFHVEYVELETNMFKTFGF